MKRSKRDDMKNKKKNSKPLYRKWRISDFRLLSIATNVRYLLRSIESNFEATGKRRWWHFLCTFFSGQIEFPYCAYQQGISFFLSYLMSVCVCVDKRRGGWRDRESRPDARFQSWLKFYFGCRVLDPAYVSCLSLSLSLCVFMYVRWGRRVWWCAMHYFSRRMDEVRVTLWLHNEALQSGKLSVSSIFLIQLSQLEPPIHHVRLWNQDTTCDQIEFHSPSSQFALFFIFLTSNAIRLVSCRTQRN